MMAGIAGIAGFTGSAAGGAPAFVPTDLGAKLLAWYDPSDLTTLDKAGANPVTTPGDVVATMRDKSGNGRQMTQSISGSRPIYQVDGSGNAYLLFDGSNDGLNCGTLNLTMPLERFTAMQQVSWTSGDRIWGNDGADTIRISQQTATPQLVMFDGATTDIPVISPAVGTNFVMKEKHIANAQELGYDNNAYDPGDVGSTNGTGVILGASSTIGSNSSNIRFYGAVITQSLTSGERAQVLTYLGNKCGLTL